MQVRSASELVPASAAWLGLIPRHWEQKKLKYAVRACDLRVEGEDAQAPYVGLEHIESWTGRLSVPDDSASTGIVNCYACGDVLLGKLRPYLAKVHVAETDGICTTEALVLRSLGELKPRYLFYYLATPPAIENINSSTYGAKMPRANWEFVGEQCQLIPPQSEQLSIVGFLDRETARIDALIDRKRRLLDLLEEKRLAVITHAVTKGLDPKAPMKESGEPHIGAVPRHWDVVPLRRLLDCGSGDFLSNRDFELEPTAECAIPVVGGNGTMGYTTVPNSPGGTLVIGRVGAHCGNIHLVSEPCWVTDNALRVTWREEVHPPFMKRLLDAVGLNRIANRNAQPLVTGSMVKSQIIAVPPVSEQQALATFLDGEEHNIDRLSIVESRAIQLLQEYRSALITNAVTGKIDVRGEAEKEAAA